MITSAQLNRQVARLRQRGQVLSLQGHAISVISRESTMDVSKPLGAALIIAQGVAKAVSNVLAYTMRDAAFTALPLEDQGTLAQLASAWTDLWVMQANVSFQKRLPAVTNVAASAPVASLYGSNTRGVAIGVKLEDLLSMSTVVGLGAESFWSVTSAGFAATGRLLAMDLVLTMTYDFDPWVELIRMLTEMVPLVPATDLVLARIDAARPTGVSERRVRKVIGLAVAEDSELSQISDQLFGRPDDWRILAQFNGLRAPYISTDPRDALGSVLASTTLSLPVGSGQTTVRLAVVNGLYPDQRLLLAEGSAVDILLVTAVDHVTRDVTVLTGPASSYTALATCSVYLPEYDVKGRVLLPGDTLLVPLTDGDVGSVPRVLGEFTNGEVRLYGADVYVTTQGHLATEHGDLMQIQGRPNLIQALRHRLVVPKGSVPHHPQYGCALHDLLGHRHDRFFQFLTIVEGRQTVLSDPRIERVTEMVAEFNGDTVTLELTAITTSEEQFPSISLSVPLRG